MAPETDAETLILNVRNARQALAAAEDKAAAAHAVYEEADEAAIRAGLRLRDAKAALLDFTGEQETRLRAWNRGTEATVP